MTIEMYQDVMNHLQIDKYRELIIEQDHKITELEKENAELKDNFKIAKDNEYEYQSLFTKAKEIIKYLCGMVRELNKPNVQLTDVDYSLSEAEQFIKDSEVDK